MNASSKPPARRISSRSQRVAASAPAKASTAKSRKPAAAPPRRTQAERREEAERRLLEAALEVVARRGSERMTLGEVGEAAGYSRGLPALRFGSKAGLLRSLATYIGYRFAVRRGTQPKREPGLDALRGSVSFYFTRKEQRWSSTRALLVMMTEGFMDASELRRDMVAYNRTAVAWYENNIRIGIKRGEICNDLEPHSLAVLLLGAMRGAMMQWLLDPKIDLLQVRDRLLVIIDRCVAKAPAA